MDKCTANMEVESRNQVAMVAPSKVIHNCKLLWGRRVCGEIWAIFKQNAGHIPQVYDIIFLTIKCKG